MKPIKFRVYGWRSSLYFLVHIWPTKKALLENRVDLGLAKLDCQAHVLVYDQFKVSLGTARRKRPIVGEIHFHRKRLETEVITHESFHATSALVRRLKFDFSTLNEESMNPKVNHEELFASVQGKLARSIVDRLYDLKLLA